MIKTLIATFVSIVVLTAFLFLNADGHPVYLVRAPLYSHNPNFPDFSGFEVNPKRIPNHKHFGRLHGWPIAGLLRVGRLPVGYDGELLPKSISGPSATTSRWPFDKAPWDHTNYKALAVNALIMSVVTVNVFFSTKGMLARRFRLSISWLLAILFVVAVISAYRTVLFVHLDWQERSAVLIAVFATLATTIRFIHAYTRFVLNRLKRPKKESIGELEALG